MNRRLFCLGVATAPAAAAVPSPPKPQTTTVTADSPTTEWKGSRCPCGGIVWSDVWMHPKAPTILEDRCLRCHAVTRTELPML